MPDPRFFLTAEPIAAAEAAALAGATLRGSASAMIARVAGFEEDDLEGAAVFIERVAALPSLAGRRVGLLFLPPALAEGLVLDGALATAARPRLAFARLAARLHRDRTFDPVSGVHPDASLGEGARVHPSAVVAAGARIGARTVIEPCAVIGPGVEIGADCVIGAGASLTHAVVGARTSLLPGARVGTAGFGFAMGPEGLVRMPQLGRALIGSDVEIGVNTTIDRGALGDTVVGDAVKIDNLVHIGHNVRIGAGAVIAAQSGVAGSTIIGARVMLGGQVGLADHLTIGDDAQIAARSGVMRDVGPGEKWGGYPAKPIRAWFRETSALRKLAAKNKTDEDGD